MRPLQLKPLDDRLAVGKTTLTSHELQQDLGISPSAASNLLARWRRAGLIDKVGHGRYAIRQIGLLGTRASSEDVALAVAALVGERPHRIAYHSALDFHGLLSRPVRTVQIASPHRFAGTSISGRPLRVVFERRSTVSMGTEAAGHGAYASNLERALLDAAARPDLVGGFFPLVEALAGSTPDADRLQALASNLGAGPALRRIGSLADRLGLGGLQEGLVPLAPPTSDLDLDPGIDEPGHAFRDREWWVRWPASPAEVESELGN